MNARATKIGVATTLIALLAGCSGSAADDEPTRTASPPTQSASETAASLEPTNDPPEAYDRIGLLAMNGTMAIGRSSDHPSGGMCLYLQSEIDFGDDNQLLLKSGSDATVGIGELGAFTFTDADGDRSCMRSFTIPSVALEEDFYYFTFGGRTSPTFSADILESSIAMWNVPANQVVDSLADAGGTAPAPPSADAPEADSAAREQMVRRTIEVLEQSPEVAELCDAYATYDSQQIADAMNSGLAEESKIPTDVIEEAFDVVCASL